MKKLSAKILLPLAPALCLFGPLTMAIVIDGPLHIWAMIGALMTGIGCMILFLGIMEQSRQLDEFSRKFQNNDPT